MIWFTKCLNTLRRWLGRPEHPPATNGETSVLFVLQSNSPKTLGELAAITRISEDQLEPILAGLKLTGRIRTTGPHMRVLYWAIKD